MDVLKSEILRKRQLVEDRNLLVVRSLGVLGAGLRSGRREGREVRGEGTGSDGLRRGWGLARGPRLPWSRPAGATVAAFYSGALGSRWGLAGKLKTLATFSLASHCFLAVSLTVPYTLSHLSDFCPSSGRSRLRFPNGLCPAEAERKGRLRIRF